MQGGAAFRLLPLFSASFPFLSLLFRKLRLKRSLIQQIDDQLILFG